MPANKENVQRLVNLLLNLEPGNFSMRSFVRPREETPSEYLRDPITGEWQPSNICGTTCCIAGWANWLRVTEDEGIAMPSYEEICDGMKAAKWLGFETDEEGPAWELFYKRWNATIPQAITALQHIDEPGFVWRHQE